MFSLKSIRIQIHVRFPFWENRSFFLKIVPFLIRTMKFFIKNFFSKCDQIRLLIYLLIYLLILMLLYLLVIKQ